MRAAQSERIKAAEGELSLLPEWPEITSEEQANALTEIQSLSIEVPSDITGLKRLIMRQFDIDATIADIKAKVVKEGKARRQPPLSYPIPPTTPQTPTKEKGLKKVSLPARIGTVAELDTLIRTLEAMRPELSNNDLEFDVKAE